MRDSRLARTVVIPARSSGTASAGVPKNYLRALREAGLLAVVTDDEDLGIELLRACGGLVLPGGADVEPSKYGSDTHPTTRVEAGLDELEMALTSAAIELDRPLFTICRGHQVLNVVLGGSLVQDLASERPDGLVHTPTILEQGGFTDASHEITIAHNSRLSSLLGDCAEVNSAHHQAIDRLGEGLKPVVWAGDGTIEAIELDDHSFVMGVQFHPERWSDEVRKPLFNAFAEAVVGNDHSKVR